MDKDLKRILIVVFLVGSILVTCSLVIGLVIGAQTISSSKNSSSIYNNYSLGTGDNDYETSNKIITNENWSLFEYQTPKPDRSNIFKRVNNYSSLSSCQAAGYTYMLRGGSFDCCKNPHYNAEWNMETCEIVCSNTTVCH